MPDPAKIIFIWLPFVAAIALAAASSALSSKFHGSSGLADFAAGMMSLSLVTVIIGFLLHEIKPVQAFLILLAQAAAAIITFAAIFHGFGLMFGSLAVASPTWRDSLYFSVVTWTTLGYGDITAPEAIRMIAATEAILGYVCFGLIVGFLGASAAPTGAASPR